MTRSLFICGTGFNIRRRTSIRSYAVIMTCDKINCPVYCIRILMHVHAQALTYSYHKCGSFSVVVIPRKEEVSSSALLLCITWLDCDGEFEWRTRTAATWSQCRRGSRYVLARVRLTYSYVLPHTYCRSLVLMSPRSNDTAGACVDDVHYEGVQQVCACYEGVQQVRVWRVCYEGVQQLWRCSHVQSTCMKVALWGVCHRRSMSQVFSNCFVVSLNPRTCPWHSGN